MADETAQPELIANGTTMTVYGVSLAELMKQYSDGMTELQTRADGLQAELDGEKVQTKAFQEAIEAKNTTIEELTKAKEDMAETIESLNLDLAVARVVAEDAKKFTGLQRLPQGGVRLMMTLDADAAVPLLSQAEQAQEEAGSYIAKALNEALLAYTSS